MTRREAIGLRFFRVSRWVEAQLHRLELPLLEHGQPAPALRGLFENIEGYLRFLEIAPSPNVMGWRFCLSIASELEGEGGQGFLPPFPRSGLLVLINLSPSTEPLTVEIDGAAESVALKLREGFALQVHEGHRGWRLHRQTPDPVVVVAASTSVLSAPRAPAPQPPSSS